MTDIDRAGFLRYGAGGLVAAAGAALLPVAAQAQAPAPVGPPKPAPIGDDVGFLSFAAVAERASRDFYAATEKVPGFTASERKRLHLVRVAKRSHLTTLDIALGGDQPQPGDFVTTFPAASLRDRAGALALGQKLESNLIGAYLNGTSFALDSGTRLLLARLLSFDSSVLAWLRVLDGGIAVGGLPQVIDLETAGARLDGFLNTPDFQG